MMSLVLSTAVLLGACGGGGSDSSACSSDKTLNINLSWNSNGVNTRATVVGKVGQPLAADPVLSGLPASCVGRVTYHVTEPSLPVGVSVDATTGHLSGTPTTVFSSALPSIVTVQPEGFGSATYSFNISITP